ncbi:MAG: DUF2188 domain-containing protein [Deltaproteobacteria bacterium]|nr:DUF2188 domain-containing protein [Deltaproteobacteria bacterium]
MLRELCVIEIGEGWAVRRQGELRLISVHDTEQQAIHAALRQAWDEQVDVLIQQRNGSYLRRKPAQPAPPPKRNRRGQASER